MSRKDLLRAASQRLGCDVPPSVLKAARRGGFVVPEPTKRLGWTSYSPESVERLVAYCRFHSRAIARRLGQDGAR
jgi:hypothetical protein